MEKHEQEHGRTVEMRARAGQDEANASHRTQNAIDGAVLSMLRAGELTPAQLPAKLIQRIAQTVGNSAAAELFAKRRSTLTTDGIPDVSVKGSPVNALETLGAGKDAADIPLLEPSGLIRSDGGMLIAADAGVFTAAGGVTDGAGNG